MEPAATPARTAGRVGHWLDHAVSQLWFVGSAPPPGGTDASWTYEQLWAVLAPVAGTLKYLAFEHNSEDAREAAEMTLAVLEAHKIEGESTARELARRFAAKLSVHLMVGEGAA